MASNASTNSNCILQVPQVIYQKFNGTLSLLDASLIWKPEDKNEPDFTVPYTKINVQKLSSANTKKVKLQLVLENDNSPTFYFHSMSALEQRNQFKDKLQEMISVARTKQEEFLAKQRKLMEDVHLRKLYKELVASNNPVLRADEFWAIHSEAVRLEPAQDTGIPTSLLTEIQAIQDGDKQKYVLNQDTIMSIFKLYPALRKKHMELVPERYTEEEFWREILQSLRFHGIDSIMPSNSNVLDSIKHDESHRLKNDMKRIKLSDASLLGEDSDYLPLSNEQIVDEQIRNTKPWIMHCNYQNRMIVGDNTTHRTGENASSTRDSEPQYKSLNLTRTQTQSSKNRMESENIYTLPSLEDWTPELMDPVLPGSALQMLIELSPGGALMQSSPPLPPLSPSMKSDLVSLYQYSSELLRHFWGCFPAKSAAFENKLHRLTECLKNFPLTHLQPFIEKYGQAGEQVTVQLNLSVSMALKKYETWSDRKRAATNRGHFRKH